jgi:AcrR family transcriptional regulator
MRKVPECSRSWAGDHDQVVVLYIIGGGENRRLRERQEVGQANLAMARRGTALSFERRECIWIHMRMSRKSRREQQAQTKEKLKQAAREEFATCGVGAASIDRISEAAGFSRGAFYSNYSGKEELLLELLEEKQQQEIEMWQSILTYEGPLESVLPMLAARFDDFAFNTNSFLFDSELRIQAMRNPAVAKRYAVHFATACERSEQLAATLIRRSGAKGLSAPLLSMVLRSFSPQLAVENYLGVGDIGKTPGEHLVALLTELLGLDRETANP